MKTKLLILPLLLVILTSSFCTKDKSKSTDSTSSTKTKAEAKQNTTQANQNLDFNLDKYVGVYFFDNKRYDVMIVLKIPVGAKMLHVFGTGKDGRELIPLNKMFIGKYLIIRYKDTRTVNPWGDVNYNNKKTANDVNLINYYADADVNYINDKADTNNTTKYDCFVVPPDAEYYATCIDKNTVMLKVKKLVGTYKDNNGFGMYSGESGIGNNLGKFVVKNGRIYFNLLEGNSIGVHYTVPVSSADFNKLQDK